MSRSTHWQWLRRCASGRSPSKAFRPGRSLLTHTLRFEPLEDRRMLATFGVINLADSGGGSLREAISQANSSPGQDTILFLGAATSGTIALTSGELEITDSLTITGPGQNQLSIDALLGSRVISFSHSFGGLTINGLTIKNGLTTGSNISASDYTNSGAGIRFISTGTLTLNNSTITGSATGGALASGGGIFTPFGKVTLTNSTVSYSGTAGPHSNGGGIYSMTGNVSLTNSTLSGNILFHSTSNGAGIFTYGGAVSVANSTITKNNTDGYAYGGGIFTTSNVTVTDSTVSNNAGGGIFITGNVPTNLVTLENSIVAGNFGLTSTADFDLHLAPGTVFSVDHSLIGDTSSGLSASQLLDIATGTGNLIDIDPMLGPLADNGGPTPTQALRLGSPAINAGNPVNSGGNDQRGPGFARVSFGQRDMGAYELQLPGVAGGSIVVDSTSDVVDDDFLAGQLSLREAILIANSFTGADTITFAAALDGQTIFLTGAELEITESLTIDASALSVNIVIDAQQQSRVLHFSSTTGDLDLVGVTITGGKTTGNSYYESGAGIKFDSYGALTLTGSTVSNNRTTGLTAFGGGIFTRGGSVTLTDSTVSSNRVEASDADGGGIWSVYGAVTITGSTISGNHAAVDGGGIWTSDAPVLIQNSTITGNTAGAVGGGIGRADFNLYPNSQTHYEQLSIHNSIIAGNTDNGTSPDLFAPTNPARPFTVDYSLIGDATGSGITPSFGLGNLLDVDPLLGPLADNGGRTQTQALLAGSPAMSAGDPAIVFNAAEFDQRGAGFARVQWGRIDIGAFESDILNLPAGGLVVDSTADTIDYDFSPGEFSLREAIYLANNLAGADTITFALSMSNQTILLTGSELEITESLTIDAAALANHVTIDAQQQSRVLNFSSMTGELGLTGLTITGGRTTADDASGGGIRFIGDGALTLTDMVVSGNSTLGVDADGGGLFTLGSVVVSGSLISNNSTVGNSSSGGGLANSFGSVTLTDSVVSGNSTAGNSSSGGGLSNFLGSVMLTDSVLSGNSTAGSSAHGGGISSGFGTVTLIASSVDGNSAIGTDSDGGGVFTINLTLTDSTLSGNSAAGNGGGVQSEGVFGGVGAVSATNSTISGNSSGGDGGGVWTDGQVTLTSSTVVDNHATALSSAGGGVFRLNHIEMLTIRNSIIAVNSDSGTIPDILATNPSATIDYSLIGDTTGSGITPSTGVGNLLDVDPLLGPLADNGGPTLTHALLSGSPALNAGDPAIVFNAAEFDQRGAGYVRVQAGRIDIGAFEAEPPAIPIGGLVVDTTSDLIDSDYSAGQFSLREAIFLANVNAGPNTITFAAGMSGQTILLTGGELEITDTLTIDASALTSNVVIDAQQNSRVLHFSTTSGDLSLEGLTVTGGESTGGGGIRFDSDGALTLTSSTISGNRTTGFGASGGGISASAGNVSLVNSTVSNNTTTGQQAYGGGIHTHRGDISLTNSTVSGNSTAGYYAYGGGLRTRYGDVTLTGSTISGNSTTGNGADGGGIYASSGTVTITNSTVSGNYTTGDRSDGGGIRAGSLTVTGSTISGNSTAGSYASGGGISSRYGLTLTGSTVSGNSTAGSDSHGGGIVVYHGEATLTSSTVTGNSTAGMGG
ncbi:beta strand repeat-containing protein, partial [Botrimarina colliarenosi]|uniref:beta strand repeat-containing protein n=1 Tax=Botrimarina colliarenosi TaxID=2528001 RepID=UPI0018D2E7EF